MYDVIYLNVKSSTKITVCIIYGHIYIYPVLTMDWRWSSKLLVGVTSEEGGNWVRG